MQINSIYVEKHYIVSPWDRELYFNGYAHEKQHKSINSAFCNKKIKSTNEKCVFIRFENVLNCCMKETI